MRSLRKGFNCLFTIFLLFTFFFVTVSSAFAYSTFYFTPSRKNIAVGETQNMQLRLNTDGDEVNAFSAYIAYPAELINISLRSFASTFSIVAEEDFSSGRIQLSAGNIDPVAGDVLLATFAVSGKKDGFAQVSFQEGSAVPKFSDSSDSLSLARSIPGFYTITSSSFKRRTASSQDSSIPYPLFQLLQFLKRGK